MSNEGIITNIDSIKQVFECEREMCELVLKVEISRQNIEQGQCYSEEEFDRLMNDIL